MTPTLEQVLLTAGFVAERRLPVLVCPPDEAAPMIESAGVEVRLAISRDDLRLAAEAQNDAYGVAMTMAHDI